MQLDQFTGLTEKVGIKCYKPINHLIIKVAGTGAASILDATLRVDLFEGAKSTGIIPTTAISHLAAFKGRIDGLGVFVKKNGEVLVVVPICHAGGVAAGINNSYVNIEIKGCLTTQTVTIHGLETTHGNGYPVRYTNLEINSDQTKMKFTNNGQFEYIILPQTNLKSIKCSFANGGTPEFNVDELVALNMSENELAYLTESSTATTQAAQLVLNDLLVMDVSEMQSWEIEKNSGSAYKYTAVDLVVD